MICFIARNLNSFVLIMILLFSLGPKLPRRPYIDLSHRKFFLHQCTLRCHKSIHRPFHWIHFGPEWQNSKRLKNADHSCDESWNIFLMHRVFTKSLGLKTKSKEFFLSLEWNLCITIHFNTHILKVYFQQCWLYKDKLC